MSLPLTTSVLTQCQEMINTAKRCNVRKRGRRGEEGGGGREGKSERDTRLAILPCPLFLCYNRKLGYSVKFGLFVKQKIHLTVWPWLAFFLRKHTEARLSASLFSCVPGELNPNHMWLWALHKICRLKQQQITDQQNKVNQVTGSDAEVNQWWAMYDLQATRIIRRITHL